MSSATASPQITYISDDQLRWERRKRGRTFIFIDQHGREVSPEHQARLRALVIPPAWKEVRLASKPAAHIQAVGYDAKGRKQYIYHSLWTAQQQEAKFDRMIRFGEILPDVRAEIAAKMRQRNLTPDKVLSTVVWLLEHTFIRVGNSTYAKTNKSYGLTTLREKHVTLEDGQVNFSFKGKSGVFHDVEITNARVAKIIQQCIELPGYEVFQYLDEDGQRRAVDSQAVNTFLRELTGEDFTAKDFRTWGGSSLAVAALCEAGDFTTEKEAKKKIVQAVRTVSQHLRNTPATCRAYYIHPSVLTAYAEQKLLPHFAECKECYSRETCRLPLLEYATWTLLKA
ncbi:MAG: DNA topoisomerase IB [bacterium]|nr:DNA topoisomerase IB [bacterium]